MGRANIEDYAKLLASKTPEQLAAVGLGVVNKKVKVTPVNGVFTPVTEQEQNIWEEPISFNDHALPSFPVSALPGWMGNFCSDVAKSMKTPLDLAGCMCLSALSLAVSKKYKVQVKTDYTEHLNIWTLTLLEPSNCKSPVAKIMTEPIRAYEKRQQELERSEIAQARELHDTKKRRLESLKNMASKPQSDKGEKVDYFSEIKQLAVELEEEEIPTPTQMLLSDITTEQLITACYRQKGNRIGALTGEGRIIFDNWTKYGQGGLNINFYLSAYSNEYYTVDRRERHEIIEEPALVMGLASQTDVLTGLEKKLFNKLNDSGLLARFLYSYPKSLIGSRDFSTDYEIPSTSKSQYFFNLADLLAVPLPGESYIFSLSSEGKRAYIEYRQQLEQDLKEGGILENHHSWGGKAHGQLIRIAGLLHAAENIKNHRPWEVKISGETIQRAIILMNYFRDHMIAVFGLTGLVTEELPAKKILKYIKEARQDTVSRRELQQNFKHTNGLRTTKELDSAIVLLEEWGYMIREDIKSGGHGKRKTVYKINPMGQNPQNPQYAIKPDNVRTARVETLSPINPQPLPNNNNNVPNIISRDKWGLGGELVGSESRTCQANKNKGSGVIGDNGDFGLMVENEEEEEDKQVKFDLLEGEI